MGQESYPKWIPGKWKHGLKPAVPWWFNFDPYPNAKPCKYDMNVSSTECLASGLKCFRMRNDPHLGANSGVAGLICACSLVAVFGAGKHLLKGTEGASLLFSKGKQQGSTM